MAESGRQQRLLLALHTLVPECEPLGLFVAAAWTLWLVTIVISGIEYFALHLPRFYWWPLFYAPHLLDDFTIYRDRFHYFHRTSFFIDWRPLQISQANFPFTYPAPAAMVFDFFFLFGRFAEWLLFLVFLSGAVAGAFLLARALVARGLSRRSTAIVILTALLLSYPFIFALDRGNIELVNALLVWAAIACMWRRWWYCGAFFLGLAISLKLFPFVLLGLLIAQRKYLATLFSVATAAVSTLLSYLAAGPTLSTARAGFASGLAFFQKNYILSFDSYASAFDHSLFTPVKILHWTAHRAAPAAVTISLVPWYYGYMAVGIASGLVLFFGRVVRLPLTNQVVILVTASLLLPPLSADYTLVHLYAPFACLALVAVSAARKGIHLYRIGFAMLLLALIVSPEGYLRIFQLRFSGLLKALALLALLLTAATTRWEDYAAPTGRV